MEARAGDTQSKSKVQQQLQDLIELESDIDSGEEYQPDQDLFGQSSDEEQVARSLVEKRSRRKVDWKRATKESDRKKIGRLVGEANMLYAKNQLAEALACCLEAVRLAPKLLDPYLTMADIYDSQGNTQQALSCLMVAVHLQPSDVQLWRNVAIRSEGMNLKSQAIYCWTKVIKRDKENIDARWQKVQLLKDIGDIKQAIMTMDQLRSLVPLDADMTLEVASLLRSNQQIQEAMDLLEEYMTQDTSDVEVGHIVLLSELYMESEMYEPTISLIQKAKTIFFPNTNLPPEIQVKVGLCQMYLQRYDEAEQVFQNLFKEEYFSQQSDLLIEIADTYKEQGYVDQAIEYLEIIRSSTKSEDAFSYEALNKLAQCYISKKEFEKASETVNYLVQIIDKNSVQYLEACVLLAEINALGNRPQEAEHALTILEDQSERHYRELYHIQGPNQQPKSKTGSKQDPLNKMDIDKKDLGEDKKGEKEDQEDLNVDLESLGFIVDPKRKAEQEAYQQVQDLKNMDSYVNLEIQRGKVLLMLGQEEAFLDLMVPIVGDTIENYQRTVDVLRSLRQNKRRRLASGGKQHVQRDAGGESGGNSESEYEPSENASEEDDMEDLEPEEAAQFKGDVSKVYKERAYYRSSTGRKRRSFIDIAQDQNLQLQMLKSQDRQLQDQEDKEPTEVRRNVILKNLFRDLDQFRLLIQVCQILLQKGRYEHALEILQGAYDLINRNPKQMDRSKRDLIKLMIVDCQFLHGDRAQALANLKLLCYRWPNSNIAWNKFSKIYTQMQTTQHWYRLLNPLNNRCPTSSQIIFLLGHFYLMMQNYTEAIKYYTKVYFIDSSCGLVPLSLGVTYLAYSMTKKVIKRNKSVLIGFSYLLDYSQKREYSMEVKYNLGRAYHQLGLKDMAFKSYMEAIDIYEESIHNPSQGRNLYTNLIHEVVHNLVLILKSSGSNKLAQQFMKKYMNF